LPKRQHIGSEPVDLPETAMHNIQTTDNEIKENLRTCLAIKFTTCTTRESNHKTVMTTFPQQPSVFDGTQHELNLKL